MSASLSRIGVDSRKIDALDTAICTLARATLEFLRPDGRVIPASGYSTDDIVDDYDEGVTDGSPSVEGSRGGGEVREAAAVYRVDRNLSARALSVSG